jgi:hypothetical protein
MILIATGISRRLQQKNRPMDWHSFIFSEKRGHQLIRHLVFWLLWWIYFTTTYYHFEQSGLTKIEFEPWNFPFFIKSILLLSIHITACYFFISFAMPRYLFRGKYIALIIQVIILGFLILLSSYFIHKTIVPLVNAAFNYKPLVANQNIWWTSITSGLLSAPKVISAAAAIKLMKRWWRKQQEKERLEKEKLVTDLQLMKSQIRPDFLFNSLDQIYKLSKKKSPQAAELLLKLADLLSYLLYECDDSKVPLEKELSIMKQYMALEKARQGDRLELETIVKGEMKYSQIAPLLLLPFIENSFKHCGKEAEQPWVYLEIRIENETLTMKLINGVAAGYTDNSGNEIMNVEKRLQLLYPGKHELKRYVENEIYIVLLKMSLGENVQHPVHKDINGHELKTVYAIQ